jgi:hypothetical protein
MKWREENIGDRHGEGIAGCGGRRNIIAERDRPIVRQACCVVFEAEPEAADVMFRLSTIHLLTQ